MGIDNIKRNHGNMYTVHSGHVSFRVEKSVPSADYWRVIDNQFNEELYASASLCKCFDFIDDLMRYSPE